MDVIDLSTGGRRIAEFDDAHSCPDLVYFAAIGASFIAAVGVPLFVRISYCIERPAP